MILTQISIAIQAIFLLTVIGLIFSMVVRGVQYTFFRPACEHCASVDSHTGVFPDTDGKLVYGRICSSCFEIVELGAPEWKPLWRRIVGL